MDESSLTLCVIVQVKVQPFHLSAIAMTIYNKTIVPYTLEANIHLSLKMSFFSVISTCSGRLSFCFTHSIL